MSGRVRGRAEVSRYLNQLPAELTKVLRGAGRAGAAVVADEARLRSRSSTVSENVTARLQVDDNQIRVTVTVKPGFARSQAIWMEYGTAAHFISVDPDYRQGMTTRRINKRVSNGDNDLKGTLLINGKPVGVTVYHPGARPYPFLRPALDTKRDEAIGAAQAYITSRIRGGGVVPGPEGVDE